MLQILPFTDRDDKVSILASSTLGPAALWVLSLCADKSHFEWKRSVVLEDTRGHDAVICSAIGPHSIAIGTYAGVRIEIKTICDDTLVFYIKLSVVPHHYIVEK